jgi:lipopolysaccharide assembly protein A
LIGINANELISSRFPTDGLATIARPHEEIEVKYLMWLLKAAIFFTLFAFALNNQQTAAVNFFFGTVWQAPLVLVVLTAFASGLVLGVFLMMPRWWKTRTAARRRASSPPAPVTEQPSTLHHGI